MAQAHAIDTPVVPPVGSKRECQSFDRIEQGLVVAFQRRGDGRAEGRASVSRKRHACDVAPPVDQYLLQSVGQRLLAGPIDAFDRYQHGTNVAVAPAGAGTLTDVFPTDRQPGFVKICGITSEDDALLAVAMGADAVGFIFAPSTSQVTVTRARDIAKRLPPHVLTVGVFRNEAPERVVEAVLDAGLGAAQLHGHESSEESAWIAQRIPSVIKAFSAGDPDIDRAAQFGAAAVLVDNITPGSGEVFDWRLLDSGSARTRLILAGGLGPDNVADAIAQVQPWGIDAKSGVEAEPGRKDPMKLRQFVLSARSAFAQLEALRADDARPPAGTTQADPIYDWLDE